MNSEYLFKLQHIAFFRAYIVTILKTLFVQFNSDQQKHVLQKVSNTIQGYVGFFCNGIGKTLADISLYCYFSLVLFSNQSDKKQEPNKKLN